MTVRMTSVLSGVVLVACIALTAHAVVPRVHPFARTRIPTSEAAVEARPAYSSCSKSGCDSGTSWDFLLFVNNWPQSVCDTTSRKCSVPSGVDYFTIHGLWPSNNDTSYPCCCNDNYFNPDNVTSIQQELEDYWTDMFPGDGDNFWEHEYNKHGTCARSLPALSDELSFFQATLKLRQQWDFNKMLNDASYYPDASKKIYIDDIQKVVANVTNATPVVFCTHDNELQSIGLCIDNNLQPMQCDSRIYQADYKKCSESYTYWKPITSH
eukprot:TRINITY_DN523_c0_g1_i2.p1 TRINITY_DN523_c0_g1~~TRINITY_DN523_c0_g1_i2.p1  ORF type:complete len:267 (+),score=68.80 TRINITY_DN523_c0_g1_i2:128-928(+)